MKNIKLFIIFIVVLASITSFSLVEEFWVEPGDSFQIEINPERVVSSIFVKWDDYNGKAFGTLVTSTNKFSPVDIKPVNSSYSWDINEKIENAFIEINGDKVHVLSYGVIYEDMTELEKNLLKYDFSLRSYEDYNNVFNLSDILGKKPVMLQFFQVNCQSCREKMPDIDRFAQIYPEIEIITIAANDHADNVKKLFESLKVTLPSLIDVNYRVCVQYDVFGVPHSVFFDMNGNIVNRGNLSIEEIENTIVELGVWPHK